MLAIETQRCHDVAMDGIAKIQMLAEMSERARCAKIARDAVAEYEAAIEAISGDESWHWAMNEMYEPINEKWRVATANLCDIAAKIGE